MTKTLEQKPIPVELVHQRCLDLVDASNGLPAAVAIWTYREPKLELQAIGKGKAFPLIAIEVYRERVLSAITETIGTPMMAWFWRKAGNQITMDFVTKQFPHSEMARAVTQLEERLDEWKVMLTGGGLAKGDSTAIPVEDYSLMLRQIQQRIGKIVQEHAQEVRLAEEAEKARQKELAAQQQAPRPAEAPAIEAGAAGETTRPEESSDAGG